MVDVSFAHVSAEGFTGFSTQLDNDVWGTIDVSTYVGADGRVMQALGSAPAFVLFKVQLLLGINDVVIALQSTGDAKGRDTLWDGSQKRFSGLIAVAKNSTDPLERAAAQRLHTTLLLGKSGEGQTRLKYHQEVDFGRKQMRLASENQGAADIALLGLGMAMASIATATEDLAAAIGFGRTDLPPARQRKSAVAECVNAFGTVYQALDWIADHGATGADREKAMSLRSSLHDLAIRYPARVVKPKTTAPAATPSAP